MTATFALSPPPPFTWGAVDSWLGRVYVATTSIGVCCAAHSVADEAVFLREAANTVGGGAGTHDPDAPLTAQALTEVSEYLAGIRRAFTVPVDLCGVRGTFLRRALTELQQVPYGHLVSYAELARRAGQPRAARAAGAACKVNPIALLVPCHRVVHAAGDLGGWTGALWHKRALLELEGVTFPDGPGAWKGSSHSRPNTRPLRK